MTIMCPVPRTNTTHNDLNDDSSINPYNIYNEYEETSAYSLSQVSVDASLKLVNLPANCRNISDEVFPGLHLGDRGAAKNTFYLKKIGVTHVLNTAEGTRVGLVDTNQNYYKPFGIKYKGLKLLDVAQTNISMYFAEVAEYIDEALKSGGKVLVNCLMGMSRSSTCVLAYLMLRQNMTAVEALTEVRRHREVRPNDGFLRQLADLDNKLRRERGQLKTKS
jgi:protein-tyrosine phosphatase